MKGKNILILTAFLLGMFVISSHAQQAISASGGNAKGSGGSASYTAGQVSYTTINTPNGTVGQGVQQIVVIVADTGVVDTGDVDSRFINLKVYAYPNPTTGKVNLTIENYSIVGLFYYLYDVNGHLIESKKIVSNETTINLNELVPSTYLLKVTDNNKKVKLFKIIKN